MDVQDLSQNLRIASLTKLMRELEQSRTPEQTLRTLERGFSEAYGFGASVLLSTRGLPQGQYRVVQMQLEDAPLNDHAGRAPDGPGPVQSGGIVAAIIARPEPQLIQEVDWSSDPFFHETLRGYASVMAIPFAGDLLPMTWVSYPLGIFESETFNEATVQLESGDTVLLYTDGITEARGAAGDFFEQDRLTRVFRDAGDPPAELIGRLREAVRAHEQGQSVTDDQTLVAARAL